MAETVSFATLQKLHESLLQKQQTISENNQQEFIREVKDFIEKAKTGGSNISSSRERDQVRANLRYWANYIYGVDKTFPDTELAPSSIVNKRFSSFPLLPLILIAALVIIFSGYFLFNTINNTSATPSPFIPLTAPTMTLTVTTVAGDSTATVTAPEETYTPTPQPTGFNVTLSSPANGESITPKIEFKGTFDNLKPGWAIHVLFIKGDKFFPAKEYYLIPEQTKSAEWRIATQLTESAEELSKAQSYSVVLAVSLDESSRELLSTSETGIDINSIPSSVLTFQGTSTVLYRNGYVAISDMRLVHPLYDGNSYDLYVSKPDGTEPRQITSLPDIDEKSPSISPDGTKIVYVQVARATNVHSIHITDSNGENDRELINGEKNILENPKWSPDGSYISYALGDTSQSKTYWSIHVYQLATGNDRNISGRPAANILNRYNSWIPNSSQIVFNAATANSGSSGFIETSPEAPEEQMLFFDTKAEEIQPDVNLMENGYLVTYTVLNPDFSHDVFAIIDRDTEIPLDNVAPVRLTRTEGGSDFPLLAPDSNVIYFIRVGNIYRVEFTIVDNKVVPQIGRNGTDSEYYGDLVLRTGTTSDNQSFDIGYINAYFPVP